MIVARTFIPHQRATGTMQKMGPLTPNHWLVERAGCPGCEQRFVAGDLVTVVAIGPGTDEDARRRARSGRAFNAVAVAAHWACVTGEEAP